jgi:hypothetical protein
MGNLKTEVMIGLLLPARDDTENVAENGIRLGLFIERR